MSVYFNGLLLGFSLIMALGPQNVFLIRQGALKRHAALSAIVCFLCDVILISGSIAGLNHILEKHPVFQQWIIWFGAAFLFFYGGRALYSAFKNQSAPSSNDDLSPDRWQILLLALGFSLLNPHAIIDSLVIIGGGSAQFPEHQYAFLCGVLTASLLWFSSLTITTRYFSDLLTREVVWRRIELGSGLLMVYLALKLLISV